MYQISPFSFSYFQNEMSGIENKIFSKEKLSFSENGIYLITGNSGSGKSTFLNLLKGISPHLIPGKLCGEFLFDGLNLGGAGFESLKDQIVFLFQNPFSQLIHRNVNLEFAFTMENLEFDEVKFLEQKEILGSAFGIQNIWNKNSFELSNGECQKLVLASLIALGPKVILLDEPTAFLDPESRIEFYKLLNQIKKNHMVFIVDHHVREIKKYADVFITVSDKGEVRRELEIISSKGEPEIFFENNFNQCNEKIEIEISNLGFSYLNDDLLFKNVNLKLVNGDVLVIKGKNGAGKSTLIKLLSKIIKPVEGKVQYRVNSKKISNRGIKKMTGFVFQNPENNFFFDTLKEELSGGEEQLISLFFSEKELLKSPYLFSEGEKRRISILINLILNKKILFMDEPTFGQDNRNKNKITNIINKMKKAGYLVVIISHDDDFIANVATKVLKLENKELNEVKSI